MQIEILRTRDLDGVERPAVNRLLAIQPNDAVDFRSHCIGSSIECLAIEVGSVGKDDLPRTLQSFEPLEKDCLLDPLYTCQTVGFNLLGNLIGQVKSPRAFLP